MGKVSTKNKKNKTNKTIDKMMGFPMEKIDKLIEQAKDLNKPKKRFDKGGSNMAKKDMSSAKFQFAQRDRVGKSLADAKANNLMFYKGKDGKKKAAVSKTDLEAFRKRENNPKLTLRDYLNKMQGKTRRKDTKKTTPVVTTKKTDTKKKKNLTSTSVGAGAVKTIAGTAAAKSVTEINRKLREKAKGEKKTETKTETKKSRGRVKKDAIKTGFLPKVAGVDIFTKNMRETADAAANKRAPNYMKEDKPSLLKRVMTKKIFPTKKQEEKRAKLKETFGRKQKPTVTSEYKKEMSYNMGGSVKVKMSKGGFKGIF
tara:strand:- start:584 stop:1522 length:939 start_codon:yes stop_codon:yes gene_type:complete